MTILTWLTWPIRGIAWLACRAREWFLQEHAHLRNDYKERIAVLEGRLKRVTDEDERQTIEEQLRRAEDEYLEHLTREIVSLSGRVVETRAPAGVISIDLPKLPEPEREGLDAAATALRALAPAETFADHFLRGNAFYRAGDFQNALEEYDAAFALSPGEPAILNNRGAALNHLKRHEEALADFNRSLYLRPDHPDTLYNRGASLARLRRYEEALADYNRSLELRPDDPDTLYNRACLFSLMERWSESLVDLQAAVAMDPDKKRLAREDEDFEGLRNDAEWGPKFWEIVETEDKP